MDDAEILLWLELCPGLRPPQRRKILETLAFSEIPSFCRRRGLRGPDPDTLTRARSGNWVALCQPHYPDCLRPLREPPLVLFYQGRLPTLDEMKTSAAIVGTRRASATGLQLARRFAGSLSEQGVTIVSGLARGIDSAAHRANLENPPGFPIAVVGCGLDLCYPAENRDLQRTIAERGLVLSEYPPGHPPQPWHFPARNRLIAALGQVLLVVEAPQKSGALTTADHAHDLHRPIFTLPGPLDHPGCQGNLALLQTTAASLALCPQDLLDQLPDWRGPCRSGESRRLHPEGWAREWNLSLPETLRQLTQWETQGLVKRDESGAFCCSGSGVGAGVGATEGSPVGSKGRCSNS